MAGTEIEIYQVVPQGFPANSAVKLVIDFLRVLSVSVAGLNFVRLRLVCTVVIVAMLL